MKNLIIIAFIVVLFTYTASATTYYCHNCPECSQMIQNANNGDTVILTEDITDHDGTCIKFNGSDGIIFDCGGHKISGDNDFYGSGIYLSRNSYDNIIMNCDISGFQSGVYLFCSSNNTLQNIISNSNDDGIQILYGHSNTVRDSIAQENGHYDFYFHTNTLNCDNSLNNVTGSGNRPIGFFNQTVNLQNMEYSALYLCNADNSVLNNITIKGSDSLKNNGLRIFYTDNSDLSDITSSNNFEGIHIDNSYSNMLNDIICSNNHHQGIMIQDNSNQNTLKNIESRSNGQCGIYLLCSLNNILSGITSVSNSFAGIYLDRCSDMTINNSYILNNNICGINLYNAGEFGANLIYNNFISNEDNINFAGTEYMNYWNITNSTGPNIIGGPYIGGNYWSDYTGNDINGDGFGDAPHENIGGSLNKDYLPLVHIQGICGDLDGNSVINIMDVRLLMNNISGAGYPVDPWAGNVDGDGDIDEDDVWLLVRHVFDKDAYPLNCE